MEEKKFTFEVVECKEVSESALIENIKKNFEGKTIKSLNTDGIFWVFNFTDRTSFYHDPKQSFLKP